MSDQDWIFGFNAIGDLIRSDASQVDEIHLDDSRQDQRSNEIIQLARQAGIKLQRVNRKRIESRFEGMRHQGIVARCKPVTMHDDKWLYRVVEQADEVMLLMLDHIQDPRNLGACLRTAAAAGVDAVIVSRDRSAPLTAVARNTASGAVNMVPLVTVTNLAQTLEQLKKRDVWSVATAGEAEQSIYQVDLKGRLLLILGNEDKGVQALLKKRSDFVASIPMQQQMESLNVSVATGIVLFEAQRQRTMTS